MGKSIAAKAIASRVGLAQRRIATRTGLVRTGFAGLFLRDAAATGSVQPGITGIAHIFATGAGGGGGPPGTKGGGGGSA
ncbi:MAG TPA: hypothetical protein VFN88_08470, partial [Caulobacteraceae bacterium]|nr:hypothetical protein [Caulobacteraceae bacterium]